MYKSLKKLLAFSAFIILILEVSACQKDSADGVENDLIQPVEYVGSENCADCHQKSFQDWTQSHHFQSMREVNNDSVLGDFSDAQFYSHNIAYRFFLKKNKDIEEYWLSIKNKDDEVVEHRVSYTFGYHPLQQYLVEFENGHIQALNVAWDSRSKEQGGQRWFHLRPNEEMSKDNIFHWERHYQNWNNRCADCHSTGLEKNYNAIEHSYDTQWSEVNVACEACHGAGSEHIRLVESKEFDINNNGFTTSQKASLDWFFRDSANIASPVINENTQSNEVDMCGDCHSFRSTLAQKDSSTSYHDTQRLQIIDNTNYFDDGQIKEETFVLGSFLQSKMYAQGVTCSNCHNPHSGAVLVEGNGLCLQCHSAAAYDQTDHHHHEQDSVGAQCVNCHMPERTYMQVDARRDHSFVVPNTQNSSKLESPNSCLTCHQDKDNAWLSTQLNNKFNTKESDTENGDNHWAILKRAHSNGEDVINDIQKYIQDDTHPVMRTAALLTSLANTPSQHSFNIAKQQFNNSDSLIRRAALSSLANMPMSVVLPNALSLINDPVRSVRFEALLLLLPTYQQLSDQAKQQTANVLDEYAQSLQISADSPEGQLAIASLAVSQLDFEKVEQAYQKAILIEPNYIPALINFADFYRATNRDELGRKLLEKAISIEPNNSSANFAYAMLLIRGQDKVNAISYLKTSIEQLDSSPYYHYVYAVGLNDLGQSDEALNVIESALTLWPGDDSLLELSRQLSN